VSVGILASSGFGFLVLISGVKSRGGNSPSNSVRWVKLNPLFASSVTSSLVLEVGRLSVVDWVGDRAGINLRVVAVVVGVVVDVGKALSISTGKAKNPLSIKIKRVLEKLDLNGFLFASA
jgi:hypothetical protein